MHILPMLHDLFTHMLLERAEDMNIQKSRTFSEIGNHWVEMYFHFVCVRRVLRLAILIQVFLVFLRFEVNAEMGPKFEAAA